MKRRRGCLPTRLVCESPINLTQSFLNCVRHQWPNIACPSGRRAFLSERLTQGTTPLTPSAVADRIQNDGSIVKASWKTSVSQGQKPAGKAKTIPRCLAAFPELITSTRVKEAKCMHSSTEHIVTARQCERKTENMKFMSDRRQRQKSTVKRGAVIHTFDHMGKRDGDG